MGGELLRLDRVSRNFGGLLALNRVSFTVPQGAIKALIGPNGAGKTTAFNVITGIYTPSKGQIFLDGRRIDGITPHRLARLGVARTFQTVRLFPSLSVLENVMVGCHPRLAGGIVRSALGLPAVRAGEAAASQEARAYLERVGLAGREDLPAGELPFGLQRLLEIARALATKPRLLLLDEPAAGLSASERTHLRELVLTLRNDGLTVFLIEHDMRLVMDLADEVVVLEYGSLLAEGEPAAIQANHEVIRAYLGA